MLFLSTCKQDVSLASHVFAIGPVQILKSSEPCADTKILQILVCLYIILFIRISTQVCLRVACSFLELILTE